jgi:outer membrane receptor for ferrienterochelin and colicin
MGFARARRLLSTLWIALLVSLSSPVLADDLADEADLHFRLGADAYQKGEYQEALTHFLASNRLVPNKNVVFNIARTFEKLRRYPEAYRYFTQALAEEKSAAQKKRIEEALKDLEQNVAVVDVSTEPAGATIYVDRKDLGPRGETPRRLGLSAGNYQLIVEKPGYEPAKAELKKLALGETRQVKLTLKQILGNVRVEGAPGAVVRADDEKSAPVCNVPCTLTLPPGPHTLYVGRPGFRTAVVSVDVKARRVVSVRPDVEALRGELVVSTDEPGALIEVDGRPVGFTPTVVSVPVGKHRVSVGLRGFRLIEREVEIRHNKQTRIDETLTQSEEVIAASRSRQDVEDAPGSVTLIPEKELAVLQYPTIAEALRGVRGIYVWDDRSYASVGVRGLGRLGSYGNRLLVLVDGQPINDNWIGSSYVGYDARTDLYDIERIEVVRGPGSVLYGTNAVSGVVNLVTRTHGVPPGGEVGVSTNLDGVARARARANVTFTRDSGMWTSVTVARSSGRDFYFPEYVATTPPDVAGNSRGSDQFEAGGVQGRAFWKSVALAWSYHRHDKEIPTGQYDTLLGDDDTHQRDTRVFVEATASPKLSEQVSLFSRAHWNHYRFLGEYARDPADGGLERDTFQGSWVGLEQRVVLSPVRALSFTVGGEGQLHYQVDQTAADESGTFLDESGSDGRPYQVFAGYASADADIGPAVHANAGARLDAYSTFGSSLNPRVALLVRPYAGGNLKIFGGKAFRAPSTYELYYNDGGATQVASPDLEPESLYSAEIELSHRFSRTVTGTVATFGNYTKNLIDIRGSGTAADPLVYENSSTPLLSLGAEAEIRREWRQGWMVAASYAYQHSTYLAGTSLSDLTSYDEDPTRRNVANSPEHLAALKGALPIIGRNVTAGTRISFQGPVYDRFELDTDPPQRDTDPFVVWDVVFSGYESHWGFRWAAGVYNAFDWKYSLPLSAEFVQRTIPQNGRTFLLSADARF